MHLARSRTLAWLNPPAICPEYLLLSKAGWSTSPLSVIEIWRTRVFSSDWDNADVSIAYDLAPERGEGGTVCHIVDELAQFKLTRSRVNLVTAPAGELHRQLNDDWFPEG